VTDETPFADPLEETALDSPILRDMLAHWRFLAGGREFPRPRELDPIDIPWALGRLTLIDVRGDWPDARFRFVLCGDRHVAFFGNDLTGLWLEDNPNPMVRARRRRPISKLCAVARPCSACATSSGVRASCAIRP
jgi:hypothetical protein